MQQAQLREGLADALARAGGLAEFAGPGERRRGRLELRDGQFAGGLLVPEAQPLGFAVQSSRLRAGTAGAPAREGHARRRDEDASA
jgi:hypothetical protein